ncbi:MAG: hypothetical protein ACOZNI_28935 [Myxococcota bacterium]
MAFLTLSACSGAGDSTEEIDPTISFLSPADGDEVTVGEVACSVVVENFTLADLAKHSEGEAPEGYIGVRVDGTEVLQTSETNFDLTLDAAGAVTVEAELFYGDDGDSLDEPAIASVDLVVTE